MAFLLTLSVFPRAAGVALAVPIGTDYTDGRSIAMDRRFALMPQTGQMRGSSAGFALGQ
jgi:hypothetical protein